VAKPQPPGTIGCMEAEAEPLALSGVARVTCTWGLCLVGHAGGK